MEVPTLALFARWPALADLVPHRPLGRFPTRVHRLELPGAAGVWIKRDDESGALYGGNKVRKLEFLLGDAARRGAQRLVTVGAYGSNHVVATAIYGRAAGFAVEAVLVPQPLGPHTATHLLVSTASGARLRVVGSYVAAPWQLALALAAPGRYFIGAGGSSPLGTLGHVSAGLELVRQMEAGECPRFDVIYVTLGSGGTAAGLHLGLGLGGWRGRLVGVRAVSPYLVGRRGVLRLARRTARLLAHAGADLPPVSDGPELALDGRFYGPGYGHATPAAAGAIAEAARLGIPLEATYTGKAFAALLADLRAGHLDGKQVLFVDTYSSTDLAALLPTGPGAVRLPPRLQRLFPLP